MHAVDINVVLGFIFVCIFNLVCDLVINRLINKYLLPQLDIAKLVVFVQNQIFGFGIHIIRFGVWFANSC